MNKDEARQRVIRAMLPAKVCLTCGEPSRRVVEPSPEYAARPNAGRDFLGDSHDRGKGMAAPRQVKGAVANWSNRSAEYVTTGFTDCGHDDWRPGVVLDPFG